MQSWPSRAQSSSEIRSPPCSPSQFLLVSLRSLWGDLAKARMSSSPASLPAFLSTSDLQLLRLPVTVTAAKASNLQCINALFVSGNASLHFEKKELPALDLVSVELVNNRGPVAVVHAPAGDDASADRLLQLSADLGTCGQVLCISSPTLDLVLLPRSSSEGVPFLVFLTWLAGVEFMAGLLRRKQVGLILDLDATLMESEMLAAHPAGWQGLTWRCDSFVTSGGETLSGYHAPLPDEPRAQSVHAIHWVKGGAAHEYCVRLRPGWSTLKQLLIQEHGKFAAHVCSLGRPVYVQMVTTLLDMEHQVIPKEEYSRRVISARPDGCQDVPNKTPAVAVGLVSPLAADYGMNFAPMIAVDDLPEYYPDQHRNIVLPMAPFKPAAQPPLGIDSGEAMCKLAHTLQQFWQHCFGSDGNGGAVETLRLCANNLLSKIQDAPVDAHMLPLLALIFDQQGRACWGGFSVKAFLEQQAEQTEMLTQELSSSLSSSISFGSISSTGEEGVVGLLAIAEAGAGGHGAVLESAENQPLCPSSKLGQAPAVASAPLEAEGTQQQGQQAQTLVAGGAGWGPLRRAAVVDVDLRTVAQGLTEAIPPPPPGADSDAKF